jgi:hypothetical protein
MGKDHVHIEVTNSDSAFLLCKRHLCGSVALVHVAPLEFDGSGHAGAVELQLLEDVAADFATTVRDAINMSPRHAAAIDFDIE